MIRRIIDLLEWMRHEEQYDDTDGFHWWPFHIDGRPVGPLGSHYSSLHPCTCTHGAMIVAKKLGGIVMGYAEGSNPSAMAGRDIAEGSNLGHDFAIVGQFLVDYWLMMLEGFPAFGILHLESDEEEIRRLYGPREMWSVTYNPSEGAAQ